MVSTGNEGQQLTADRRDSAYQAEQRRDVADNHFLQATATSSSALYFTGNIRRVQILLALRQRSRESSNRVHPKILWMHCWDNMLS
jgi:hypothetical protein